MSLFIVIGLVGSVASIIALLLPAEGWKAKATHVVYGIVITLLAVGALTYKQEISRVHRIERAATELIKDRRLRFSNAGFIQASLAYLEKNQDLYPDTYKRAEALCEAHDCTGSQYGEKSVTDGLHHGWGLIELASAMEGLLRGLADIHSSS